MSVVRTNRQLSLTGAVGVALQGSQVDLAGQMGVSITSQASTNYAYIHAAVL